MLIANYSCVCAFHGRLEHVVPLSSVGMEVRSLPFSRRLAIVNPSLQRIRGPRSHDSADALTCMGCVYYEWGTEAENEICVYASYLPPLVTHVTC